MSALLVGELRAVQIQHGDLPAEAPRAVADRRGTPLHHAHGAASVSPHDRLGVTP